MFHMLILLNMSHRPLDVAEQIGLGFEPGGKAHQAVAYAEFGALLGLESRMRCRRRMGDQALRIPESVRDVDEPQRIEKAEAAFLVAGNVSEVEAEVASFNTMLIWSFAIFAWE